MRRESCFVECYSSMRWRAAVSISPIQTASRVAGISAGARKASSEYRVAGEEGPDHQKLFHVEVWSLGECLATGDGSTKKEAEQKRREQRWNDLKARKYQAKPK